MYLPEYRIALPHLSPRLSINFAREGHRNLADVQREFHHILVVALMQVVASAERRMPGKRQLLLRRKDSNAHAALALLLCISRNDKRGFAQVRLSSDSLHLRVR